MQDDDNDDHEDDNQDEEDEPSIRSYSKKKHFGKLGRDLRMCNLKITYKPSMKLLNTLKFTGEGGKNNSNDPITSNLKWKVDHKYKYEDFTSKSKVSFNLKNQNIQNAEVNNKLSKNVLGGALIFSNQINQRREWSTKISHTAKLIQNLKLKYGIQCDSKNERVFGMNLRCEIKRNLQKPSFISFIDQYNELFTIFGSIKTNKKTKIQTTYKSHLITKQNNRMYLEHKGTYDSSARNNSPFSHTLTFNAQDSEGIGTINSSINFQNLFTIKSKEVRLLIEYNKMLRFGVQKRNNIYEFMIERYRINQKYLKSMKLYVGNKGILSIFDGKFGLGKNKVDYTLNMKLKPDGNNFYEDFSMGLGLKWNI